MISKKEPNLEGQVINIRSGRNNGSTKALNILTPGRRLVLCLVTWSLVLASILTSANGFATEEVTLQLKWKHQFQFAGYYAAIEKGFYRQAGLSVQLVEGGPDREVIQEVTSGRAQFGVSNSQVLLHRLLGKPLIVLAVIFQHSPLVFVTRQETGITSPQDMIGKVIRMTRDSRDVELHAALLNEGIPLDRVKISDSWVQREDYFDPDIDVVSAYLTNEIFYLIQENVPFQVIQPRVYGSDFYGDCLITSEKEAAEHPDRVKAFREASLKGWVYAMDHPEEIIEIIQKKYHSEKSGAHLRFEAEAMKPLILPDLVEMGHVNPGRWDHIAKTFVRFGLVKPGYSLDGFLYDPNTQFDFVRIWWVIGIISALALLAGTISVVMFVFNRRLGREISERKQIEETLRESEERYRTVADYTSDWEYWQAPDGSLPYMSPSCKGITGYSAEEFRRDPDLLSRIMHPEDRNIQVPCPDDTNDESRKNLFYLANFRIFPRDGGERWIAQTCRPVFGNQGEYRGLRVSNRDITERHKAIKALKASETKHRAMIANISDVIAILDHETRIKYTSPNIEKWFGWHPSELVNSSGFEVVHPDDLERLRKEYEQFIHDDLATTTVEFKLRCKNGTYHPIELTAVNLTKDSVVNGILVNYHDITARKQAEEALEKRIIALTQPLDHAFGVAFEEMFNLDDIQRIQDMFAQATGVASLITQIDGTPITRPSNYKRLCTDLIKTTEKGQGHCREADVNIGTYHPSGPTIRPCPAGLLEACANIIVGESHIANWLIGQVRTSPRIEETAMAYAREIGVDEKEFQEAYLELPVMSEEQFGRVAEALFTFAHQLSTMAYQNIQQARFIADRNRAEKENEKLQDQLNQAKKMEAIGTLAGGVAHDFNNLLQVINGFTEILIMGRKKEEPEYSRLSAIQNAGQRAAELIQQLMLFSRKVEPQRKPINFNREVVQAQKILERTIPKMIEIELDLEKKLWAVKADPVQIEQIFLNLGSNAADAMPDGGKIRIKTENIFQNDPQARFVQIVFSDNGPGMDRETAQHIFEPFYTTKEIGKGTGLGLASVYGIVKSHGGNILCFSKKGRGASFQIVFPAMDQEAVLPLEKNSLPSIPSGGAHTILIADDEPAIRELTSATLQESGYSVLTAASGEEALSIYSSRPDEIDLVILDIGMPGMGGNQCLRNLVKLNPLVKILVATGYSISDEKKRSSSNGMISYLGKPYKMSNLISEVQKILKNRDPRS